MSGGIYEFNGNQYYGDGREVKMAKEQIKESDAMTDLKGLELRKKACEALGWVILRECRHPNGMEGIDPAALAR